MIEKIALDLVPLATKTHSNVALAREAEILAEMNNRYFAHRKPSMVRSFAFIFLLFERMNIRGETSFSGFGHRNYL